MAETFLEMKSIKLAALAVATATQALAGYVWPSPYDFLEDLLAMQQGYIRMGFTDCTSPLCFFIPANAFFQKWLYPVAMEATDPG